MSLLHTLENVADELGVARRTIQHWKTQGCEELNQAPYDVDAVARWRRNRKKSKKQKLQPKSKAEAASLTEQRLQADIELKKVRKRLHDYDLQLKQGKLVLAEDVKHSQARLASEIKKHLLRIPDSYADSITNLQTIAEAKEVLEQLVFDTLALLSKGED
ncbi:terminase small subunit [Thalassoroseus pseudoceratinae]|uniref:terminase small subunit n=1 Tax=Thalassoroseus pseudoceratinae TaxID=2713176 RepID=UPI001421EE26|nr:terminase small subunit [Thalassoroseus pseudoceratinae]